MLVAIFSLQAHVRPTKNRRRVGYRCAIGGGSARTSMTANVSVSSPTLFGLGVLRGMSVNVPTQYFECFSKEEVAASTR